MRQFESGHFTKVADRPLALAVVVPVLNECANIRPTLDNLALALADLEWEVLFVDDGSTDGTPELVAEIAAADRRVRLIRRFGRRGLASAVMEGICASTAPVAIVMDGDLQHDASILPQLHDAIAAEGCDIAVGSRYAGGGSIGDWSKERAGISRFATRLAAPFLKAPVSDPMSGFFAIRRETALAAAPRVSGVGYKILLDLLASTPGRPKVKEIPYRFGVRQAGASKLDEAVALEYLELLCDKAIGRWVPPRLVMFGAVGALGLLVHLAILGLAVNGAALDFATGQALAVLGAMTFNYALNNRFTYRDRRLKGWRWLGGLFSFCAVCSLGAIASVGVGSFVHQLDARWWVAGAAGALIGSVWNYVGTAWFTWARR